MIPPRVTVGLPVYCGENYLAEAVESVLNQTFYDFELIISDNGSTDATAEIGRYYANRDVRVRYYRSDHNRGASWNFNQTVMLARGDYFRWLAHDDLFAPTLLEKSVAVLESCPEIASCITWFTNIDAYGNPVELSRSTIMFDAESASRRFASMIELRPTYNCEEVFGMVRTSLLRQTKMIADYADSDRTLIAELGLHGPFSEIREPLFAHRLHEASSVVLRPSRQERAEWFDPEKKGKLVFPHWRQLFELMATIKRSPISLQEKMSCLGHLGLWTIKGGRRLGRDVAFVVSKLGGQNSSQIPADVKI